MDIEIMGQTFWLYGIKGTVKGVQKWTSTSVQSTGQGTITDLGYGAYRTSAPQISSTTNQHQEFWIVSPGGREKKIEGNYDVRDGQTALVVWGSTKNNKSGYNLIIRNCTTGAGWITHQSLPASIVYNGCRQLTKKYLFYIISPFIFFYVLKLILHTIRVNSEILIPIVVIYIIVFVPVLLIVGYNKRCKLTLKNHNSAMFVIGTAINNNPQFVKSLEA